jgi:hypothetical protein
MANFFETLCPRQKYRPNDEILPNLVTLKNTFLLARLRLAHTVPAVVCGTYTLV